MLSPPAAPSRRPSITQPAHTDASRGRFRPLGLQRCLLMVPVAAARPLWELRATGDTPPVWRECQNTAGVLLLRGRKKGNFLECEELSSNKSQAEIHQECPSCEPLRPQSNKALTLTVTESAASRALRWPLSSRRCPAGEPFLTQAPASAFQEQCLHVRLQPRHGDVLLTQPLLVTVTCVWPRRGRCLQDAAGPRASPRAETLLLLTRPDTDGLSARGKCDSGASSYYHKHLRLMFKVRKTSVWRAGSRTVLPAL